MTPQYFPEQTVVLAEDQPEYLPLPVHITLMQDQMISCWRLTWRERLKVFCTGRLWLRQLTFGERLQPQLPEVDTPFVKKGPKT